VLCRILARTQKQSPHGFLHCMKVTSYVIFVTAW